MNKRALLGLAAGMLVLAMVWVGWPAGRALASDSGYTANLDNLWANEVYEKVDLDHRGIGASFGMHFVDFLQNSPDGQIWGYYIKHIKHDYPADDKIAIGLAKSTDGIQFTDYGVVLDVGAVGEWDSMYASFPGVWYEDGTFYLAYEGAGADGVGEIGLATSTDGLHFTKQGIILAHNTTGFESYNIGTPDLYKVGSTWYLTYHGYDSDDCQIGIAYGTDLFHLTKYANNPIIPTSATGDATGTTGRRDVTYYNGYYYMVYEISGQQNSNGYARVPWGHAFARSTDMLNWEQLAQNPLVPMTVNDFGGDGPSFLTLNGVTWIYYRGEGTTRARLANELNGGYDRIWEAENMAHNVGRADGEGWSANVAQDNAGYMVYGPAGRITDLSVGENTAVFKVQIDNNTANDDNVMRIEVYDYTTNTIVKQRIITRKAFSSASHYEFFSLPFQNDRPGHELELRVYYYDTAYINVDRVFVNEGRFYKRWYAIDLPGLVGRMEGVQGSEVRAANIVQDNAGYLTYGPYDIGLNAGSYKATWVMQIDNNTYDNADVARLEVYDYDANTILAQRTVTRGEFARDNKPQGFSVNFTNAVVGHRIEYRTYYYKQSYLKLYDIDLSR